MMSFNNPFIIIFIFLLFSVIIYVYYNYSTEVPETNKFKLDKKLINKKKPKKVHFNDNIEYKYFSARSSSTSDKKYVDKLVSDIISDNKVGQEDDNKSFVEIDLENNVVPSGISDPYHNPEDTWDASFGLPLMSKDEKNKYFSKMQKNHKEYGKSMSEFTKYQTDNSTLIKTDITIDPFKPEHKSATLKGKTIKEIYDEQVAGPKAVPKKIKKKTPSKTIYENESEMNGGEISGTDGLHGFDGVTGSHKSASFGNEF